MNSLSEKTLTMNFEKLESGVISILLIFLIHMPLSSQDKVFALQNKAGNTIVINKYVSDNIQLDPFLSDKPISGLAISCDINFNSDSSLVRIILVDEQYHEYLVCETYPLLSGFNTFSLTDFAEETSSLPHVIPHTIEIEIVDASVFLKEITTGAEVKLVTKATVDISLQQNLEKIKKINENIKKKGGLWVAGETSVSKLTYKEKKELFGGRVPNLQGFEFYIGGIFAMPGTLESETKVQDYSEQLSLINASPFADEFSWRNRHGQDWVTPVKNQGGCGSCWAFGAIGATELLVNLFYNRHLDYDLSEQNAVSCFGSGSCAGGDPGATLDYIRDFGIVTETCFPYAGWDEPCMDKCANPSEIIKIGGQEYSQWLTDSIAKEMIIEGPVACALCSWVHVITLVGYKVIREGDYIFNFIIPADHPYIGRTAWLLKNSWGEDWGDKGYAYTISNIDNLRFNELFPPVSSLNYKDSDIACLDEDGDGYYNWGIGPKPPHCPPCPDEPDGDDSNPCLGPMDKFGHIRFFTKVPSARDTSVLAGDIVPDLTATGEDIRWYGDKKRESLLYMGNSFPTGQSAPGIYTYFITQTLSGCESDIIPVKLIIHLNVPPPIAENVTIFSGEQTPTLFVSGDNIKWYADPKNPFYDARDGQTYETTLIGNQLWMAENLNYYTPTGSFYYNNDSLLYAKTYGRLYDMTVLNSCPLDLNWHLPSDEEWIEMEMYLGMTKEETHNQAPRGAGIGGKLKETGTVHWESPNADATNEVGFNARPAGWHDEDFSGMRTFAGFFALAEYYSNAAYLRTLDIYSDRITRSILNNYCRSAFSIRCVLNPSEPIATGNSYKPVYILPGKYIYYVTQTISGFESPVDTLIFNILSEVPKPEATDVTVCENLYIPDLFAAGQNIKWYSDPELVNLLHSGNSYFTGKTLPGKYTYYVTQSIGDHVSEADTVSVTINPLPAITLGNDTSIFRNQSIILGPFDDRYDYTWNIPSTDPYFDISGNQLGLGNHTVTVKVTDTNACSFTDSININVIGCVVTNTISAETCESYTSPSGKIWSESGEYKDTIPNAQGCDSVIIVYLTTVTVDTSVTRNQEMLTAKAESANYQWIDCNNDFAPIYGEQQQTFSPSEDGHYAVVVSQNDCSDTSACFSFIKTGLVINTFTHNITIYPNPNDGSFTIDLGDIYPNVEITVTELDGQIIRKDNLINSRIIELQVYAPLGMYVVTINSKYEKAVLRILKK